MKIASKPWLVLEADVVKEILLPKGFIGEQERRSYHYAARYLTNGQGAIIDAGSCLGASAYCLASGLSRNQSRSRRARIHCYDQFVVREDYVGDLISAAFRPSGSGDDFFDIFEFQTGQFSDLIHVHKGDFLEKRWNGDQIDILFIDLAKTKPLNDHIIKQFFTSLYPSESLVIHQDYYHCWNPYIHISMHFLRDKFEILDRYIPNATRMYKLIDSISSKQIDEVVNLSKSDRIDILDDYIASETGDQRAMGHAVKLSQLWHDGDVEGYDRHRRKFFTEFEFIPDQKEWAYQTRQMDQLIENLRRL